MLARLRRYAIGRVSTSLIDGTATTVLFMRTLTEGYDYLMGNTSDGSPSKDKKKAAKKKLVNAEEIIQAYKRLPPETVRIGSYTWKIWWWNHEQWLEQKWDIGQQGRTQPASMTIHIRTSMTSEDSNTLEELSVQAMAETLIHECLHAIWFNTALGEYPKSPKGRWDHEEYAVGQLAPHVMSLMIDNPELVEWVQSARAAFTLGPRLSTKEE